MRPTSNLEAKRLWMLTTVTYVLVIVFTILAVVAYRYMDTKIRSDRHADYDQHN